MLDPESALNECNRCGEVYNWLTQETPDEAGIFWEPSCPYCGSNLTDPPVTESDIKLSLDTHRESNDGWEEGLENAQAWARHLHNRKLQERKFARFPPLKDIGLVCSIALAVYLLLEDMNK